MKFTPAVSTLSLMIVAVVACAADEGVEPVARTSQAIVGGQASTNPAVGIAAVGGGLWESAVLVAPNIVLTHAGLLRGTNKITAFYTGNGTAVAATGTDTKPNIESIAGLTKHTVKSSGSHPMAVVMPYPIPANTQNYPYKYEIAYAVLDQALAITPLPYGNAPVNGTSCTTLGYGANGTTQRNGQIGLQRQGTVTITNIYDATVGLINVAGGPGFNNQGDSGGPLLCGGNVVGLGGLYHFNNANVIDQGMYQSTATVKAWIDSVIAANPPPAPTVDAGAGDASTGSSSSSGGASSSSGGASSSGGSGAGSSSGGNVTEGPPVAESSDSGCNSARGSASGFMLVLAAFFALRRKKAA